MVRIGFIDGTERKYDVDKFVYFDRNQCFGLMNNDGTYFHTYFPRENVKIIELIDNAE